MVSWDSSMENHHVEWENLVFLWSCSIAMFNYKREKNEGNNGKTMEKLKKIDEVHGKVEESL